MPSIPPARTGAGCRPPGEEVEGSRALPLGRAALLGGGCRPPHPSAGPAGSGARGGECAGARPTRRERGGGGGAAASWALGTSAGLAARRQGRGTPGHRTARNCAAARGHSCSLWHVAGNFFPAVLFAERYVAPGAERGGVGPAGTGRVGSGSPRALGALLPGSRLRGSRTLGLPLRGSRVSVSSSWGAGPGALGLPLRGEPGLSVRPPGPSVRLPRVARSWPGLRERSPRTELGIRCVERGRAGGGAVPEPLLGGGCAGPETHTDGRSIPAAAPGWRRRFGSRAPRPHFPRAPRVIA